MSYIQLITQQIREIQRDAISEQTQIAGIVSAEFIRRLEKEIQFNTGIVKSPPMWQHPFFYYDNLVLKIVKCSVARVVMWQVTKNQPPEV